MGLAFFYINSYAGEEQLPLDEETSRHVVQVLRMKEGEQLNLTDGKGHLLTCTITSASKKHCMAEVTVAQLIVQNPRQVTIAISLLKNTHRFEWFLEKATEIGVNEIIPLICERTEKERFRYDRMQGICISAMLQSQQCWLPVLREPAAMKDVLNIPAGQKFIAHCLEGQKQVPGHWHTGTPAHSLICIGPEGDFTKQEIEAALKMNFISVSLGATRLRTETAGVVAAVLLCHS